MTDDSSPWLIVGLGNPGPEYAGNRHNVGFMVADLLAERMGAKFKAHKARAQVVEGRLGAPGLSSRRVVVAKPMSFMNLSGGPTAALRDFYKVPAERVIAVHDELDIDYGTLRLKLGGGDNGHNGLKSITKALGPDYCRVRFGIGRPPGRMQVADFVLKDFSSTERKELDYQVDRAADAVEALIVDGLERAQNTYNI
ncbi:aminoacyl-tRNA hydrolase [Streptomyces telluris]|uniref:Peptidyl-tRNA hydrolase n=1 Tax=Streptomyces telluris TaxID=2720021 RepID=A0A9X2LKH3_9ACTN|nr:aminoacyl-tRNA hydrolase [Streptomyces telluris]MCQ8772833.1 aminoacyl-tRNA hydrolase [Streptomyces telluris]NJP78477.1 aminoacyl-tRNA hydrolase [Streptomyces telluris]